MGMVAMKCPQCGADFQLDETREFGFCSYCGTKVMQEKIVVEHKGSVKVDTTDELNNLYIAARNATEAGDKAAALDYYRKITTINPNSWEALFYSVILGLQGITNGEIEGAAARISNCLPKVFQLISEHVSDENEKKASAKKVADECYRKVLWLIEASHSFRQSLSKGNGTTTLIGAKSVASGLANGFGGLALSGVGTMMNSAAKSVVRTGEDVGRCLSIVSVLENCGNTIEKTFDVTDEDYKKIMVQCWKAYITLGVEHAQLDNYIQNLVSTKINKYDPSFAIIEKNKSTKSKEEMNKFVNSLNDIAKEDTSYGKKTKNVLKMMFEKYPILKKLFYVYLGIAGIGILILIIVLAIG